MICRGTLISILQNKFKITVGRIIMHPHKSGKKKGKKMKNNEKNLAYAIELLNEAVHHGVLLEKDNCIAVAFATDTGEEKWYYVPKLWAAKDMLEQNAFETIERSIAYAKSFATVKNCLKVDVLFKDRDGLIHQWMNADNRWENELSAAEDIAKQKTFTSNGRYNPKSQEYLQLMYEVAVDTECNCPPINTMLFQTSELAILMRDGGEGYNIYYFKLRYFNPGSSLRGQVVQCPLDRIMTQRIISGEDWIDVVAESTQYPYDIDAPNFFELIASLVQSYHNGLYIGQFYNSDDLIAHLKGL